MFMHLSDIVSIALKCALCVCVCVCVCDEAWVVTCRRHDPSVHQTTVRQHGVSPALRHTLQPLGRSSRPRTAGRKHRLTLVIRQFSMLRPRWVARLDTVAFSL